MRPRSAIIRRVRRDRVRKMIDSTSLRGAWSRRSRSVVITRSRGSLMHGTLYSTARSIKISANNGWTWKFKWPSIWLRQPTSSRWRSTCARSSAVIAARIDRSKKYRIPAATGLSMNSPDARTAAPSRDASSMLRPAADHDMQADVERGIFARDFSRGRRGGLRDHQARTAQNSVATRAHDGGVDLGRQAEVVGVNDQALQTAPPRIATDDG